MADGSEETEQLDLDEVRALLRSRLAEVSGEVGELTKPPERGSSIGFGKRVGDGTSEAISRFTEVGIANDLQVIRARLERALEKLDEGTYGVCDGCGGEIAAGRLRAAPESVFCISCASGR
jgi:DnaK suppressor protein